LRYFYENHLTFQLFNDTVRWRGKPGGAHAAAGAVVDRRAAVARAPTPRADHKHQE